MKKFVDALLVRVGAILIVGIRVGIVLLTADECRLRVVDWWKLKRPKKQQKTTRVETKLCLLATLILAFSISITFNVSFAFTTLIVGIPMFTQLFMWYLGMMVLDAFVSIIWTLVFGPISIAFAVVMRILRLAMKAVSEISKMLYKAATRVLGTAQDA